MSNTAPAAASRSEHDAPRWFAVWTRSRHERAVHDQLIERGIESFLPTITRWSRWKDRRKQVAWPLFPGYCFVHIDPRTRLNVLKCSGVVAIVGFNGEPAPVPDDEVDAVRRLVESTLPYDPCPLLKAGMRVEVVHGPLKGVVGKLERKGGHARLVLAVDLIGRAVSVQVDAADVREL